MMMGFEGWLRPVGAATAVDDDVRSSATVAHVTFFLRRPGAFRLGRYKIYGQAYAVEAERLSALGDAGACGACFLGDVI